MLQPFTTEPTWEERMATAWEAQQKDTSLGQITFDERLGLLVDAECFAEPPGIAGSLVAPGVVNRQSRSAATLVSAAQRPRRKGAQSPGY